MINIMTNIIKRLDDLEGAYAPNTLRSYYADARSFVDWCIERNIEPFQQTQKHFAPTSNAYKRTRHTAQSVGGSRHSRTKQNAGIEDQTRTEEVYLAIRRLKRSKCLAQKQAVGINHDILVKMIDAQPNTIAGTRNRALLSLGYDFLTRRSELVAIRTVDLKFTPDGALQGLIRKSKPTNTEKAASCLDQRGARSLSGSG